MPNGRVLIGNSTGANFANTDPPANRGTACIDTHGGNIGDMTNSDYTSTSLAYTAGKDLLESGEFVSLLWVPNASTGGTTPVNIYQHYIRVGKMVHVNFQIGDAGGGTVQWLATSKVPKPIASTFETIGIWSGLSTAGGAQVTGAIKNSTDAAYWTLKNASFGDPGQKNSCVGSYSYML